MIFSIAIALLLASVAIGFVALPLVRREEISGENSLAAINPALEELLFDREVTYAAIKDLEFDHTMGKLSQEDYQRLDHQYRARAVNILKELEEVEHVPTDEELDQWIEEAVRMVESGHTAAQGSGRGGGKSARQATPPSKKRITSSAQCPECGRPYGAGDRFCSACGGTLLPLCSACGGTSEHNARYCTQCGTELTIA
ncbi:MAG: hypothetical protein GXP41_03705 [Chloroflexi bacterium]|nr:hypothetical protein [Chloroflexota bacterium]